MSRQRKYQGKMAKAQWKGMKASRRQQRRAQTAARWSALSPRTRVVMLAAVAALVVIVILTGGH